MWSHSLRPYRCLYILGLTVLAWYHLGWKGALFVTLASIDIAFYD